eukprot:358065-Chlamydomonas_euryale.AAC.1
MLAKSTGLLSAMSTVVVRGSSPAAPFPAPSLADAAMAPLEGAPAAAAAGRCASPASRRGRSSPASRRGRSFCARAWARAAVCRPASPVGGLRWRMGSGVSPGTLSRHAGCVGCVGCVDGAGEGSCGGVGGGDAGGSGRVHQGAAAGRCTWRVRRPKAEE